MPLEFKAGDLGLLPLERGFELGQQRELRCGQVGERKDRVDALGGRSSIEHGHVQVLET
jgi:hypothetical protein